MSDKRLFNDAQTFHDCTASNGSWGLKLVNMEMQWEETVIGSFQVLCRHLLGGTEETVVTSFELVCRHLLGGTEETVVTSFELLCRHLLGGTEETVVTSFELLCRHLLGVTEKSMKGVIQSTRSPSRDMN
jgi:L-serine deaminase